MSPPGWYPDPWLPTRWRYFDGAAWTAYIHPPAAPPQSPAPQSPAPQSPAPQSPAPQSPAPQSPSPGNGGYSAPVSPAPAFSGDPWAGVYAGESSRQSGINSSPAAWWWAGGTLGTLLIVFLALAWLVNR